METETTSGAFPDLISAALHGAGISGDDLAFDFEDAADETDATASPTDGLLLNAINPAGTLPTAGRKPARPVSDTILQSSVPHTSAQQLTPNQRMMAHIINPPHVKSQQSVLQNSSQSVIRVPSQTVLARAGTTQSSTALIPQGVQSFRIVRATAPPASPVTPQPAVQGISQASAVRSQPIPRHMMQSLAHVAGSQVIGSSHSISGNDSVVPLTLAGDAGLRKVIRIPSTQGPHMKHGQFVVQSQQSNGPGQSKVLKVTATNGKPVTHEDITKIVNSLPNLKNGSKIIVNTSSNGPGTPKTIQVITKPSQDQLLKFKAGQGPLASLHRATVTTSNTHINPTSTAINLLPIPQQRVANRVSSPLTTQGPVPHPSLNSKISCLPFPTVNQNFNGTFGQLGSLSVLSNMPVGSSPALGEKINRLPRAQSHRQIEPKGSRPPVSSKELAKAWSDPSILRRSHSAQNFSHAFKNAPPDEEEIEEEVEELGRAETYAEYKPSKLNFGKKHPDAVVETSSLSSVEPPDVWYQLQILDECVEEEAKLSALQLESITYACQRHTTVLPNGERAGYLIGDGAGVGKGRTIAGIIFENYVLRRKRAIWLSVSNDLKVDAERDLRDIGAGHINVYPLNKFKYYAKLSSKENNSFKKGVIFATYSSLIGESQADGKYNTRLKQLLKWLGRDFEGLIVFDECHKAKNLCPTGSSKPTKTGQTVLELQNRLPKARVVYASATGASEPKNMAYMTRLGLWGTGTPFKDFGEFIQAVERRGVGAMELVAMDAKLRGMYIARQLSFHGVSFRIDEIPLEKDLVKVYNLAVEMWVEAREMFQQAAELVDAEHRMKKTMWGQFWSAHQRFFKYLCISAKVNHCVDLAREAVKMGKCVVIGLQSTGEARTMEQVEESGGELTDFVSTAKGVFQSLVERHFPASTRGRALDIIKRVSNSHQQRNSPDLWRKKKEHDDPDVKKQSHDSSDPESSASDSADMDDIGFISSSSSNSSDCDEDGHNPFANGWNSDEDDPWCQKKRKRKDSPRKKKKVKKRKKDKESKAASSDDEEDEFEKALAKAGLLSKPASTNGTDGHAGNWEKASAMKSELLSRIEFLGEKLPPNTLDQLIDDLGGKDSVAEMTGRKSRVILTDEGVQFESRSEADVPLEILNLTEKQRFMDGEKSIAIISEAASSGISLQADRRAINQKRRVHITLELPWSADRAIQQFGRTHRSNQVSAPEYVFLISELAGERRFASTVAKRLESLGALTHGDRRATESRDLSRFNIDNKYGRTALEVVMKSVLGMQTDIAQVSPPKNYKGDFYKDVKDGLVGVGMIIVDEKTGYSTLEKDFNNISKFLNRILGMKVTVQNALFNYFTETLTSIILEARRSGRWDMGILDLGSGEERVRKIETKVFVGNTATNTAKTELTKFAVERGMPWHLSMELWRRCTSLDEGFYCPNQDRGLKKTVILVVVQGKNKKRELLFNIYKPNTGLQGRCELLEEIRKKYKKCLPDVAQPLWEDQYTASETQCSHRFWRGGCRKAATGQQCEFGLRTRFYHVLSGSVLSVWSKVESVLLGLNAASRMQIIRLRTEDNQRIIGSLIPTNAVLPLERVLGQDSAKTYTEKHNTPFNYQPYIPSNSFINHSSSSKQKIVSTPKCSSSSNSNSLLHGVNSNNSLLHGVNSNNSASHNSASNNSASNNSTSNNSTVQEIKEELLTPKNESDELLSMPTFVW